MVSRRERLALTGRSLRRGAKKFSKSKLGMAGLIIILGWVVVAVFAQNIDANDPVYGIDVSGRRAAPTWLHTSPYSVNVNPVPDPYFHNPNTYLTKWTDVIQSPTAQQYLTTSWTPEGYPDPGGVNLTYLRRTPLTGPQNTTISFQQSFNYGYDPPFQFAPSVAVNLQNFTSSVLVSINMTLRAPDGHVWQMFGANIRDIALLNEWYYESPSTLASVGPILKTYLLPNLDPLTRIVTRVEPIVFNHTGTYTLSTSFQFSDTNITNTAKAILLVDSINFTTKGTNFGLLGTDGEGRDIFSQLVNGARLSLIIGITAALIAVGVGTLVGLLAGYFGGGLDEFLRRFTDILLTIPRLPLLLVLTALLSGNIWINIVLIIGLLGWQGIARVIRSQTLTVKGRVFVESAKAVGASGGYIVFNHVLPNVMDLVWVNFALSIPDAIVTEAALSFLGLGDPTVPTWGFILNDAAASSAITEWWWALPPGIAIALLSMGFVLVGYALDDILNPRLRKR